MTPLELEVPAPPEPWWSVSLTLPSSREPLVDPGMRLPAALELELMAERSVIALKVPAADEPAAIAAACMVVRVLLGRWPGLVSAEVQRAPAAGLAAGL